MAASVRNMGTGQHEADGASVTIATTDCTWNSADLIFIVAGTYDTSALACDNGFTELYDTGYVHVWYRNASGWTGTTTISGAANEVVAQVFSVQSHNGLGSETPTSTSGVDTTAEFPTFSTNLDNELVLVFVGVADNNAPSLTSSGNLTGATLYDAGRSSLGSDVGCAVVGGTMTTAGSIGSGYVSYSQSDAWRSYALAVKPASASQMTANNANVSATSATPNLRRRLLASKADVAPTANAPTLRRRLLASNGNVSCTGREVPARYYYHLHSTGVYKPSSEFTAYEAELEKSGAAQGLEPYNADVTAVADLATLRRKLLASNADVTASANTSTLRRGLLAVKADITATAGQLTLRRKLLAANADTTATASTATLCRQLLSVNADVTSGANTATLARPLSAQVANVTASADPATLRRGLLASKADVTVGSSSSALRHLLLASNADVSATAGTATLRRGLLASVASITASADPATLRRKLLALNGDVAADSNTATLQKQGAAIQLSAFRADFAASAYEAVLEKQNTQLTAEKANVTAVADLATLRRKLLASIASVAVGASLSALCRRLTASSGAVSASAGSPTLRRRLLAISGAVTATASTPTLLRSLAPLQANISATAKVATLTKVGGAEQLTAQNADVSATAREVPARHVIKIGEHAQSKLNVTVGANPTMLQWPGHHWALANNADVSSTAREVPTRYHYDLSGKLDVEATASTANIEWPGHKWLYPNRFDVLSTAREVPARHVISIGGHSKRGGLYSIFRSSYVGTVVVIKYAKRADIGADARRIGLSDEGKHQLGTYFPHASFTANTASLVKARKVIEAFSADAASSAEILPTQLTHYMHLTTINADVSATAIGSIKQTHQLVAYNADVSATANLATLDKWTAGVVRLHALHADVEATSSGALKTTSVLVALNADVAATSSGSCTRRIIISRPGGKRPQYLYSVFTSSASISRHSKITARRASVTVSSYGLAAVIWAEGGRDRGWKKGKAKHMQRREIGSLESKRLTAQRKGIGSLENHW